MRGNACKILEVAPYPLEHGLMHLLARLCLPPALVYIHLQPHLTLRCHNSHILAKWKRFHSRGLRCHQGTYGSRCQLRTRVLTSFASSLSAITS